jgi:hypothetical protein
LEIPKQLTRVQGWPDRFQALEPHNAPACFHQSINTSPLPSSSAVTPSKTQLLLRLVSQKSRIILNGATSSPFPCSLLTTSPIEFHDGHCTASLIYNFRLLSRPLFLLHNQLAPWPYHALLVAHKVACVVATPQGFNLEVLERKHRSLASLAPWSSVLVASMIWHAVDLSWQPCCML